MNEILFGIARNRKQPTVVDQKYISGECYDSKC